LPGRPLLGWADDVAAVAEHLGAEQFGVVGWSGGAPFAAAVARALPDCLTGVCLVSSASLTWGLDEPVLDDEDRELLDLIRRLGREGATLRLAADQEAWVQGVLKDGARSIVEEGLGDADRMTLQKDPSIATGLADSFREAFRQGAIGMVTDWVTQVPPWGFSLRDIEVPVHLWHGAQDTAVTTAQVKDLAAMIPRSNLTVWPDHGHLGITEHWPSVLATCIGDRRGRSSVS
jgi:pimeloyl-ACP methyl ester carboxylesterase